MALFKLRKNRDEVSAGVPPESIDAMRARARHRLIGAAVLVLVAVIGFPLLFDTQPRPVPVDIAIEIPDRNKVKPLPMPAPASSVATPPPAASSARAAVLPQAAPPEPAQKAASTPVLEAKPAAQRASAGSSAIKTAASAASAAPVARADDAAKARALLEGKADARPADAAPAELPRFVVQVGAFADEAKVREVRQKLEKAGLKTLAQTVDTKDGKRTRVRLGPFTSRDEAEKAAARAKDLELPGNILAL